MRVLRSAALGSDASAVNVPCVVGVVAALLAVWCIQLVGNANGVLVVTTRLTLRKLSSPARFAYTRNARG